MGEKVFSVRILIFYHLVISSCGNDKGPVKLIKAVKIAHSF